MATTRQQKYEQYIFLKYYNVVLSMVKFFCTLILLLLNMAGKAQYHKIAIALHGGASNLDTSTLTASQKHAYLQTMDSAITEGYTLLSNGASSEEAVVRVVSILEDSPMFNAGKGSVLTTDTTVEMDAAIMRGKDLHCGAVAAVRKTKNPIQLAQLIMNKSAFVFLAGDGADKFAEENHLPQEPQSYFITPFRLEQLKQAKQKDTVMLDNDGKGPQPVNELNVEKHGTVGCVAIDKYGNLAAATSTGGLVNKSYGRIGDSPIIGAGTYANNKTCAVSCTGKGETFIRLTVASEISALMRYNDFSLERAVRRLIQQRLRRRKGRGGCIAVDKNANIVMSYTTNVMFRACIDKWGDKLVLIGGRGW